MTYTIDKTELEDFVKACDKRQLSEYDFTINGHEINEILKVQLSGKVVISKGNITKQYDPSKWPAECAFDIEAGIFD